MNKCDFSQGVRIMISQKTRTNVYLDKAIKEKAKEIYKQYGVSLSEAINMFLVQSVMERGLPFEMKIPNDETVAAMNDIREGKTEKVSFDQLEKEAKKCLA
jgi:DNA-damage-inducible protein J